MAGLTGEQAVAPPAQDMYFDDSGVGSDLAGNAQQRFDAVAQQLAAQGIPPPAPGSLTQIMNDPNLRTMMMGAIKGVNPRDEELARLKLAAGKEGAYVQTALGNGSQYQPTIAPLYAQAAQKRGRAPLGQSLRGGRE